MDVLQDIHSIVRWVIVVVGLLAAAKSAYGWLMKAKFGPADRGLMSGFVGLLDLQLLLGAVLLIGRGVTGVRMEHATTMLLAVAAGHFSMRWRSAPDAIRFRNNLIVIVVVFALVSAGVARLPQGWFG